MGRSGARFIAILCSARIGAARFKALPRTSERSTRVRPGATAPDSSRVMSRRLAMKRLRRSASSWTVSMSCSFAASS